MSEFVFILGAGASKEAGAPLMANFLDVAEGIMKSGKAGNSKESFRLVFAALSALDRLYAKSDIDLENLEAAFAAFEMGKLIGRVGDISAQEVERLPGAMQQVILTTIESTVMFPVRSGAMRAQPEYMKFVQGVLSAGQGRQAHGRVSTVITFNYDLCLDYACMSAGQEVDYCLGDNDAGRPGGLALIKLHGSLNWALCPGCGRVVAWRIEDYYRSRRGRFGPEVKSAPLPIGSQLREFRHCGEGALKEPLVVPPTWNKGAYHGQVEDVWRAAAKELENAEHIFVFGYSLPETDQFFKYLYALGSIGTARLKTFSVFDPDPQVSERFRALLGPRARHRFHPSPLDFRHAAESLPDGIADALRTS